MRRAASCLPVGFPSLAHGFAPAGFGLLGPFLQRHGKPSSRARRSYSARTASLPDAHAPN